MSNSTLIVINSKDRQSGSHSDFRFNLNRYPMNDVQAIRVNKIVIPYSFYAVPAQTFEVTVNAGVPDVIVFPGGNYNANQLATALQTRLNADAPATAWTVTYSSTADAFTVTVTGGDTFTFDASAGLLPANQSVLVMAGLTNADNYSVSPAPVNSYTSPYAPIIGITANVNVSSSKLNIYRNGIFNGNDLNVFQVVPVNVNSGDWIIWQNTEDTWFNQDMVMMQDIDLKLLDDYGNVIDMRGRDWIIELEFKHLNNN